LATVTAVSSSTPEVHQTYMGMRCCFTKAKFIGFVVSYCKKKPDANLTLSLRAGQSQPPNHLSMFLEVTDPRQGSNDWSCFVSHRLTVVNQKSEDRAVAKESQVCTAGLARAAVLHHNPPVCAVQHVKLQVLNNQACPAEPLLACGQGLGLAGVCDADQPLRPGCWLPCARHRGVFCRGEG
jgi:hypothetical protein